MPEQGNQNYLDALLADLQSTTDEYQHQHSQHYSQVNVQHHQQPIDGLHQTFTESLSYHQNIEPLYEPTYPRSANTTILVTTRNKPPPPSIVDQPIYANQEAATQTNMSSAPATSSSLNKNLSQLDSLLEDLNSAQFMAEVDRRSGGYSTVAPATNATSNIQTPPPSASSATMCVENLLAELQDSVPYTDSSTPKTQAPLTQSVVTNQRTYQVSKEPMASSATRDLDDLMASLSEFKMNTSNLTERDPHVTVTAMLNTAMSTPASSELITPPEQSPLLNSRNAFKNSPTPPATPPFPKDTTPPFPNQQLNGNMAESTYANERSMKVEHYGDPPYAKPLKLGNRDQIIQQQQQSDKNTDNLESMLGALQSDMNKHGVSTVQKGHCAACRKPIVGQVITALGKIWHPEHFTCAQCKNELGTRNFFERDGLPFCEPDYHGLFSPKCAYCNGAILDKCVSALDTTWHPEHFFCAQCGRPFEDGDFHEKNGKPYCREDYFEMFAPKCGGCCRPIMDNYISALSKQWHPECFICQDCHMPFSGGSFFEYEGLPYCETHYHEKKGSLCAGCNKPITGRCITAMYKKFHPEHFVCVFCLRQLNKGTFKEQNDKPYCHACFVKLFG